MKGVFTLHGSTGLDVISNREFVDIQLILVDG